jgi:hypothetical protein
MSDSKLPWRPHDVAAYAVTTRGFGIVARLSLIELLDHQWMHGALPADREQLRRLIVGCTKAQWSVAWPDLEPLLPLCADGQRRNAELAALRTQRLAKAEASRRNGIKGGRPPKLSVVEGKPR